MANIDLNKIAFVFPGQGSQSVGMGQDICNSEPDSKNTFRIVNEACNFDLYKVSWVGPVEALNRTIHTQPALYATSAACLQAFRRYFTETPLCVAGHSLGELTALWAAGVYTLADGAKLTAQRAYLMDNAPEGAMAVVLGGDKDVIQSVVEECQINIANYNTAQQKVISGDSRQIQQAVDSLKEKKIKVIPLAVSGAFHSPLMLEANAKLQETINSIEFQEPQCPIIQNVTAKPHTDSTELKQNLSQQMVSSVYWEQSVEAMLNMGVESFIEIGSGKVLTGLIKKIEPAANVMNIFDPESLNQTLQNLN